MTQLIIVFGNTPDLSFLELSTLYPRARRLCPHAAIIEDPTITPGALVDILGGAVRIAVPLGIIPKLDPATLAGFVSQDTSPVIFGLGVVDTPAVGKTLLEEIKRAIAPKARFIEPGDDGMLSAVAVEKQQVIELLIFPGEGGYLVGKTLTVQPFEKWSRRDRGRPYADPHSGMLPPKIARMMVNIAGKEPGNLLDPFCGMGTIPAEALLTGWNVIGSDQSEEAVKKAEANLTWLNPSQKHWKLFASDATHISEKVEPISIDAVVTEPFLGTPAIGARGSTISEKKIHDIVRGLEKLYTGCLKDWHGILTQKGKVVMALPRYWVNGKTYFVKRVIDRCETLGYTVHDGPIEYSRPQAAVRREIFVFRKV